MRSNEPDVVIDLSGPTLPPPVEYSVTLERGFAAVSATRWVVANTAEQLVDVVSTPGTPRFFGAGRVWALVGSPQRVAIALARGEILLFDTASKTQEDSIAFAAGDVEMSADGTILFASARSRYSNDWTLNVFALPSGQVLATWPYPYPSTDPSRPHEISLSPSGQLFGKVLNSPLFDSPHPREVTRIDGTLIWSDTFTPPLSPCCFQEEVQIHFSPDSSHIAVADQPRQYTTATKLYTNFVHVGAANGWPVGWIDDSRLLVNLYRDGRAAGPIFTEAVIVGPTGTPLGTVPLPELRDLQSLGAERVYSAALNDLLADDGQSRLDEPESDARYRRRRRLARLVRLERNGARRAVLTVDPTIPDGN